MTPDPLDQLYDIEGLDPISWWPLAPGWWCLAGLILLVLAGLCLYMYRKRVFKRSWQYRTLSHLSHLDKNLDTTNVQATLTDLSEIIRRVAMHRYSRIACAGLEGEKWLSWLTAHDPHHFDWEQKGHRLVEAPYAPAYQDIPLEPIHELIQAIRRWI